MWQYTSTNELMHYGKKGMRWGKRTAKLKAVGSKISTNYKKAVEKHESTHDERMAKQKKTAKKVARTVAITYGTLKALDLLAKVGNVAFDNYKSNSSTLIQIGESFMDFTVS